MSKYISNFYDVNKKTQTEQVLENMEQIDELKKADEDLQENIDAEEQARAEADAELQYSIEDLQSQIDAFGNVFILKGSVATISDLPAENNNVGDVYYVESEYVGYIWIDDNGSQRWEQLGLPVDLSNYITSTDLTTALEDYQKKLTAGTNITILGNTISAQQPDISGLQVLSGNGAPTTSTIGKYKQFYLDESTKNLYQCTQTIYEGETPLSFEWTLVGGVGKQNKLTAGTNISIDSNNVISASGGSEITITESQSSGNISILSQIGVSDNMISEIGNNTYLHIVKITTSDDDILCFIVNNTNDAFTYTSMITWLNDNGYTSVANSYKNVLGVTKIRRASAKAISSQVIRGIVLQYGTVSKVYDNNNILFS